MSAKEPATVNGASGFVVGTAGHVDHGKSALISALTGIHPDRLKEEQERKLSIDLGFAWMNLPSGSQVGFVDVPGHIDFIENMLAGVGGIDAALFVIAADEGVMPQTREHLAILDLLEIDRGVVALTKVDLIHDAEWLDLIEQEARELLRRSSLENAKVYRVSSKTSEGLEALAEALAELSEAREPVNDPAKTRLPIDRSFSISGFGTVVTGTLLGGPLEVGEVVEALPSGHQARIRGLETHSREVERAMPRSRVAVNLSGVSTDKAQRGDLLTVPGSFIPSDVIDVVFRLLPDASGNLKHNQELKMFLGPAQRMARVRMLSGSSIEAGQSGVLQLLLNGQAVTFIGERFILRRPSPTETLGGGVVLDPHPLGRHKLGRKPVIDRLAKLQSDDRAVVLAEWLSGRSALSVDEISRLTGWKESLIQRLLDQLVGERLVRSLGSDQGPAGEPIYLSSLTWDGLVEKIRQVLSRFHTDHPLKPGIPKAELRERLRLGQRLFDEIVKSGSSEGWLTPRGASIGLSSFSIELSEAESQAWTDLLERFERRPYEPPSVSEARDEVGQALYSLMKDRGELVEVSSEIVFHSQDYDHAVRRVLEMIENHGEVTVAEVRDDLNSTRKYILALLESLDASGVTIRVGDVRQKGPKAGRLELPQPPLTTDDHADR